MTTIRRIRPSVRDAVRLRRQLGDLDKNNQAVFGSGTPWSPPVTGATGVVTATFGGLVDYTGLADATVHLPDITAADVGKTVTVVNASNFKLTLDGDGSDKIHYPDKETYEMQCFDSVILVAVSTTQWRII